METASAPRFPLYLAGRFEERGATRAIRRPDTGALLGEVSLASEADASAAAEAASRALPALRALSSADRSALLARIEEALTAAREEIARGIALEAGKPIQLARGEVDRGLLTLRTAAEEAKRIGGAWLPLDLTDASRHKQGVLRRFPAGPVIGIAPFNFPLNLVLHKLAPALACGCPIVLKPADPTPLTALRLARLVHDAAGDGLPPGALSVLPCEIPVAETLVRDPRFRVLSFTGSAAVGRHLRRIAAAPRIVLELGGNAGAYVDRSAGIAHAARRCAIAGFAYAGQTCIKSQRLFVHREVFGAFRDAYLAEVAKLGVGDPLDEGVLVGPLIRERDAIRVEGWIDEALAAGATRLAGGPRAGSVLPPAVLTGVPDTAKLAAEEVFGPATVLEPVDSAEEAFARIDDSRYGLQAAVFTQDLAQVLRAHERLEVGAVVVNDATNFRIDSMPYGGVKDSGLGREGVRSSILEFTEERLLVLDADPAARR